MKQQQRLAAAENGESQQQAVGGKRTPTNCDAVVFSRFDFRHEFPAVCRWTPVTKNGRPSVPNSCRKAQVSTTASLHG
jgi:hypothetical protein